jgi:hypothetical protein
MGRASAAEGGALWQAGVNRRRSRDPTPRHGCGVCPASGASLTTGVFEICGEGALPDWSALALVDLD